MKTSNNKQTGIVRLFPDWPVFRRLASKEKIKQTYKTALTDEEASNGESSIDSKMRIVSECRLKWENIYKRIDGQIDEVFKNIDFYSNSAIDLEKTRLDMMFKYFAYGFLPNEYFG